MFVFLVFFGGISNLKKLAVGAQSETRMVNVTFHNYSVLRNSINGSYFIYDGADSIGPRLSNAHQVTLNSEIYGIIETFGFEWTYWSGALVWVYDIQEDIHVQGTAQITVYMNSSDVFSGFFSGGGYGMGLVELDENLDEVQRFMIEGPQSLGSNPLSTIPQPYTLSLPVDHIFPKEHRLGFFVGAGGTERGYNFTVHFDSLSRNSGASIPVVTDLPTPSPTNSPTPSPSPTNTPTPSPSPFESPTPSPSPSPTPSENFDIALDFGIIAIGATIITIISIFILKKRLK
jgi:hypothetical protein